MTATHTISYKEAVDLGFKREDHIDEVFFDLNGYRWFTLTFTLDKGFYLDWDCEEHTVELVRWKEKTGDILGRLPLFSVEEIKEMIGFFMNK